jgi:hypothetical protein
MEILKYNMFNESNGNDLTLDEFKEILQDSVVGYVAKFDQPESDYYECSINITKPKLDDGLYRIDFENSEAYDIIEELKNLESSITNADIPKLISVLEDIEEFVTPRFKEYDNCDEFNFDLMSCNLSITYWLK